MGRSASPHSPHPLLIAPSPFPFDLAPVWDLATELAGKTNAIFTTLATTINRLTQSRADLQFHVGPILHMVADSDHLLSVADGLYRYGTLLVHPHPRQTMLPALPLAEAQSLANATSGVVLALERSMQLRYRQRHSTVDFEPLSPREREVLTYLYQRFTKPEIAAAMHISLRTIETHQKRLYKKLGVHRESEAILVGLEAGYFLYLA